MSATTQTYKSHTSSFFNGPPCTEIYTLSLHDALPISSAGAGLPAASAFALAFFSAAGLGGAYASSFVRISFRSEEHTSELQSHVKLVCRLLLEKKKQRACSARLQCLLQPPAHTVDRCS